MSCPACGANGSCKCTKEQKNAAVQSILIVEIVSLMKRNATSMDRMISIMERVVLQLENLDDRMKGLEGKYV